MSHSGERRSSSGSGRWNGMALAREAAADLEEATSEPVTSELPAAATEGTEDEKLFEELLRLKLTSAPDATAATLLAPSQRVKMFQPRTKLEQFEDILIESQLLDFPSEYPGTEALTVADDLGALGASGLLDFDATDAIFNEKVEEQQPNSEGSDCSCTACVNRSQLEAEKRKEVERLRQAWKEVRDEVRRAYHSMVTDSSGEKPDLSDIKPKVQELCNKDPHQLYHRLESSVVKEVVVGIKLKLIELLQKQAKNPSLAQDFIQSKFHPPPPPNVFNAIFFLRSSLLRIILN